MMSSQYLLKAENLSIGYPHRRLYQNLNFEIPAQTRVGILGANGSGKSTFVKTLLGIIPPLAGHYHWGAKPTLSYVPQEQQMDLIFPLSVEESLKMGDLHSLSRWKDSTSAFKASSESVLELFELENLRHKLLRELSGGQRQRALIARALISHPDVLILDEPLNSLDSSFRQKIWNILDTQSFLSWMMIDHDLNRILHHVDWLCLLDGRQIRCAPKAELMKEEILSEVFGEKVHLHEENGRHQIHFL